MRRSLCCREASATHWTRPMSSFSLFLRQQKGNPAFQKSPIVERGKALGEMWRGLSAEERAKIKLEAAAIQIQCTRKRKAMKKNFKKKRAPSAYNLFVKEFFRTVPAGKSLGETSKLAAAAWKNKREGTDGPLVGQCAATTPRKEKESC